VHEKARFRFVRERAFLSLGRGWKSLDDLDVAAETSERIGWRTRVDRVEKENWAERRYGAQERRCGITKPKTR
jgi:hypothetical protein